MLIKICLFVSFCLVALPEIEAACFVCNSNGVACTSNNTFQLCFNGLPNSNVEYVCPNEAEVCTVYGQICMDPSANSNVQTVCGNTQQCGQCSDVANGAYTCTSRTTFTMCMNNALTSIRGTCPLGAVCRTSVGHSGSVPCVNECLTDANDMCDVELAVDAPTTSETTGTTVIIQPTPPVTIVPPVDTTVSVTSAPTQSPEAYCSGQTLIGRYPNSADSSCVSYLYCSSNGSGSGLTGRIRQCPLGKYFNPEIRNCQTNKPVGCV
ncbi:uncharacterized protein LOC105664901 [Ceratitis capitata]|uniref:uncharacterized protein LOC105664900 n=1 Tax=Ceratitis capitata TaxID=7213 RepID=UPI000618842A|nr:uncharacterized protein LOC105664900 [Ceratitis capitata]XP_012157428.1 uncharacterized protein LOC105664901 [Ceratitis capitata]